jgi:hypothetical protein
VQFVVVHHSAIGSATLPSSIRDITRAAGFVIGFRNSHLYFNVKPPDFANLDLQESQNMSSTTPSRKAVKTSQLPHTISASQSDPTQDPQDGQQTTPSSVRTSAQEKKES